MKIKKHFVTFTEWEEWQEYDDYTIDEINMHIFMILTEIRPAKKNVTNYLKSSQAK